MDINRLSVPLVATISAITGAFPGIIAAFMAWHELDKGLSGQEREIQILEAQVTNYEKALENLSATIIERWNLEQKIFQQQMDRHDEQLKKLDEHIKFIDDRISNNTALIRRNHPR